VEHQWGVNLSNAPSVHARDVVNVSVTIPGAARTTRCAARNSSVNHHRIQNSISFPVSSLCFLPRAVLVSPA